MTAYTLSEDGTGKDYSVSTHNAATFSPGDVIEISGVITSQLIPPSSGSSGSPITYTSDGTCDLRASSGVVAISYGSKSYITFDGLYGDGQDVARRVMQADYECSNIIIQNCEFENYDLQALAFSGTTGGGAFCEDVQVIDNIFRNIGDHGDTACADVMFTTNSRRITHRGNVHYATRANRGVDGIVFTLQSGASGGATGHVIENNIFSGWYEENGVDLKGVQPGSSGETITIVRNNQFIDASGTMEAIHLHNNTNNVFIHRNYFNGCKTGVAFIGVGTGDDSNGYATITSNVFIDITSITFGESATDYSEPLGYNVFSNNTLINCGLTNNIYTINTGFENLTMLNNVFYSCGAGNTSSSYMFIRTNENLGNTWETLNLDSNCYYHVTNGASGGLIARKNYAAAENYSFTGLQSAGMEANGMQADPLIGDTGRITSTASPLFKAGTHVYSTKDYDGNTFAIPPTIGAYEISDVSSPVTMLSQSGVNMKTNIKTT